jgi:hypothetical protein
LRRSPKAATGAATSSHTAHISPARAVACAPDGTHDRPSLANVHRSICAASNSGGNHGWRMREHRKLTQTGDLTDERTSELVHRSCWLAPTVHRTGQSPAHRAATLAWSDTEVVTVTDSVQGGRAPRESGAWVARDRPGGELADHGEPPARDLPESDLVETVPWSRASWSCRPGRAAVAP